MRTHPSVRVVRALRKPLMVVIAVLPLIMGAQGANAAPALSGPSTARVAQAATFNGSGFAPNGAVSISVAASTAGEAHFSAVATADGKLSYSLTPSVLGMYTLKVLDPSGKVLATTHVHATP